MFRRPFGAALVVVLLALAGAFASLPGATAQAALADGPGGPILVVTDGSSPFGGYYAEILRAEGLNEFAVAGPGALTPATLGAYQVVVLAATDLSGGQLFALGGWVAAGGNLIAMKPAPGLAGLLGLAPAGGTVGEGYLKVDTGTAAGAGITGDTMQFHGSADLWSPAGASTVATLYSDANSATANPAVSLHSIGGAGGQVATFTYDLAKSVVETRQGNPEAAGKEQDGQGDVIRSDDLFFPSWLDFAKVRIPQADEQQRLLANLITQMNLDRAPLPRFWYLPRGERAAVVMSGDDHNMGGTTGQFNRFKSESPVGCSVADWECIRATSYVYPNTSIPDAQGFEADGFEIALHLTTGCGNFDRASLISKWDDQLPAFRSAFPSLNPPVTNRTHCIAWSDWASEPIVERANGIRLDTNYYYWPGSWVNDRPGMFTGSGMPMRFADVDGSLIDVYQAATQMTDESGIDVPKHINTLLDGALGTQGYYGVFTANMHTDLPQHAGADAIVAEATRRGVPVISARQMLDWLDGRNGSSFGGVSFSDNQLRFSVAGGARGLVAMLPASSAVRALSGLSRDGAPVSVTPSRIKGIDYVLFDAAVGNYVASYGPPTTAVLGRKRSARRDRSAPRIKVLKRTVRASRKGDVRIRVKCPRAEIRCRLDIRLRLHGHDLARKKLTVKRGKTVNVKLRLKRSARARLAKQRSLRVKAVIKATDAAGNRATRTTKIKLLAPR